MLNHFDRKLSWLVLVTLAAALVACSGSEAKKAKFMEKGKALIEAGDYKMARLEFKNALQIDPKLVEAHYLLGMVALKEKDFKAAMGSLNKAVSLDPNHLSSHLELAKIYAAANQLDKAKESLDVILQRKPDDADALLVKAATLIGEKKVDDALALLERQRAAGESRQDIFILITTIYSQRQDNAAIERTLNEGITANPKAIALHMLLARFHAGNNRLDQAAESFKAIIAIEPEKAEHHYTLADLYWRADRQPEAEAVVASLRAKLKTEEDFIRMANFFLSRPEPDKAETILKESLGKFPQGVKVRMALAEMHVRQNKADSAKQILNQCLAFGLKEDNPDLLGVKNAMAQVRLTIGEIDEAEKLVDEVLKQSAANVDAQFTKGTIRLAKNDAIAAVGAFRTVVKERPEFMTGHLRLAQAHMAANETGLALDVLGNALKINPKARDIRMAMARVYAGSQEFDQAEDQLSTVLTDFPQDAQARAALGDVLFAQKHYKEALEHYQRLHTAAPDNPMGYLKIARVHNAQKNWPKAQAVLEEGLGKTPDAPALLSSLLQVFLAQHKSREAIIYLEKRIQANEKDALAHTLLGRVHMTTKEFAKAESAFRQAVAIAPLWDAPHANLAQALIAQGKQDGAIEELEKRIASDPKNLTAYMTLGVLYQQSKNHSNAKRVYAKALDVKPDLWQAANNLAFLLSETSESSQDLNKALQLAQSAAKVRPDDATVMDTLGWTFFKMGDMASAVQWLEKALAKEPDNPIVNFHLGMALKKAGRTEEAKSKLVKSLEGEQPFDDRAQAEKALQGLQG
jgi:tetratricopeptide (TPR) repeat protein